MLQFAVANSKGSTASDDGIHWYLGRGVLHLRLPNFSWRQQAIDRHDAHHLLTGYPCTPAGEMQMAAWEFAAGRFRHPCATAFCLPLVGLGAIAFPRLTFSAYVRGRRSTTLYGGPLSDELLSSRVIELRQRLAPAAPSSRCARDWLGFATLVALSITEMLAVISLLTLIVFVSGTWLYR